MSAEFCGDNKTNGQDSTSTSARGSLKRDRQTRVDLTNSPTRASADPKRRKLTEADNTHSNLTDLTTDTAMMMEIDESKSNVHVAASSSSAAAAAVPSSIPARRRAHSPVSKKKMVIKPFKVKPQLAATFEEDTQLKLTQAVEAVYEKKSIDMSQEELYRAVEALCIHNKAAVLYEKLVGQCEKHVAQLLQTVADHLHQQHSDTAMSDVGVAAAGLGSPTATSLSIPFLQQVQSVWSAHCDEMIIIRGIFLYLDRTFVIQLASSSTGNHNNHDSDPSQPAPPKSLWDMGLGLFCTQLKKHPTVEEKVISGLLSLIERERHGESVNRSLLKSLLRMFAALKLYVSSFQSRFLDTTTSFYQAESARMLSTSTPVEYIHYIQQRLQQEEERANAYLDEGTRVPLVNLTQQLLITTHSAHMLGGWFKQLLDSKRSGELGAMYKLFEKVSMLDEMKKAFQAYVQATATEIVESGSSEPSEHAAAPPATPASTAASSSAAVPAASPAPAVGTSTPATMILDLLKLKVTLDQLLAFSFASNAEFIGAMKEAFEKAINSVENKPAELIAKFLDKILKTGGKGIKIGGGLSTESGSAGSSSSSLGADSALGNDEVESLLNQTMFLFRYIQGKDVFQAFYKKDLAKRLLLQKSASIDAEKSMIAKIKSECGASFTTKLEGMFKDMDLSRETQIEYEQHRQEQLKSETPADAAAAPELTVQVLTTGSWPAYTPVECTLPKEVARMHEDFKLFYLNKHSGRKLIWHHSLAGAILRAHFPKARKELSVSGIQAVVLMLFNEHTKLTMEEIGKYSGLTDVMEVKRTLASLTFTEDVKILVKEPRNKKLSPTDVFSVNADFTHKLFRIKVNSVQLKETKEEQKTTTTRVFEDRQYALDAAIVRIMKARKTMSHQLLIMEVVQQVKFPTKPADIKKRIASLIEREYMERDKENSAVRSTTCLRKNVA